MIAPDFLRTHRKAVAAAVVTALVASGVWLLVGKSEPPPEPWRRGGWDQMPTTVRVVAAAVSDLDVAIKSIGTVTPLNTVTVRSRVEGVLTKVHFSEGAEVKQGDLLAEIDPQPYRAKLAQAEGTLQQNRAQLENAKADLQLYEKLWEQDSIARQQLSSQQALVEELQGTIQANKAEVEDARLQLSWTRIEAPIAGKLGLRRMDAGNLVNTGDGDGLVTITQMRPITVTFTVPEQHVGALRSAFASGKPLQVEALDRSEQQVLASGELTTLDNQIDTATGTLKVKAQFANADDALFPNQFVNVRLGLSTLADAITIPSDAVQHGANGTYVYVVTGAKAHIRPIELGPTSNELVAVEAGLQAGELVVLEGLDRLRDGKEVIIPKATADSATTPESKPEPETKKETETDKDSAAPVSEAASKPAGNAAANAAH